ncbi:hypothetical protein [Streptomyces sp. ISL-10]|nr:hypothetical protein [Streptomyces sp. ISL-10]
MTTTHLRTVQSVDLNDFKAVKDKRGHSVEGALLVAVSHDG